MNGFVTSKRGESLNLGSLTVKVNHETECFQTISPKGEKETSIPCNSMRFVVGTHLRVTGFRQPDGTIRAEKMGTLPPSRDAKFENSESGGPSLKGFRGGAFLEEAPKTIESARDEDKAILWINGIPLEMSRTTTLRVVAGGVTRHDLWEQDIGSGFISVYPRKRMKPADTQSNLLVPGVYVSYQAVGRTDRVPLATSLNIFPSFDSKSEREFLDSDRPKIIEPDYVHGTSGTIELRHGTRIEILANRPIQEYVGQLGAKVIPAYSRQRSSGMAMVVPRFYVVRPFQISKGDKVDAIDGLLRDRCMARSPINPLEIPSFRGALHQVSELPNGIVLVPDTALLSLQNQAQLEFLLSVAAESVTQQQPFLIATKFSLGAMGQFTAPSALAQNQRMIRMAIRDELLAGYDILEAPFAFAAQLGIGPDNPLVSNSTEAWLWPGPGADTEGTNPDIFPWYGVYGFAYIEKYYSDRDYGSLKRGDAEYKQFLRDLSRADPEAFEQKR